ncbi:MAG: gamma-glutamyl-gamma-aminobutyrate hydrolase family protein [Deltaproteobacteria bacterium]|nr:gamma-glutamyl-gamma-aminobutyrate hydrolase family protein [Deltaproteobacteria bacterium]
MPAEDRPVYKGMDLFYCERAMLDAIARAGGIPFVIRITTAAREVSRTLKALDGVVLSGGADVSPLNYGETAQKPAWAGHPERDAFELAIVRAARKRRTPILGICRGHQLLNVAFGGSLWQDVVTMRDGSRVHRDASIYDDLSHTLSVAPGSRVAKLLGKAGELTINSIHHQGVKRLGRGLIATAWAADGLVEAIEYPRDRFTVGVQWHPEWMDAPEQRRLFRGFVRVCGGR